MERTLNWKYGILPTLRFLFTDKPADIESHFHPLWNRLNALVHGSALAVWNGFGESCRHVFNHFDEPLARELLADTSEVLSLVFLVMIRSFPAAIPSPRDVPRLVLTCPPLSVYLDRDTG